MNRALQHRSLYCYAASVVRSSHGRSDGLSPLVCGALALQSGQMRRRQFSHGVSDKDHSDGKTSSSAAPRGAPAPAPAPASSKTKGGQPKAAAPPAVADLSGVKHQVGHRATEKIGIGLAERVVERVAEAAEHGAERAAVSKTLDALAERAAVKTLAEQAAARTAERAGSTATYKAAASSRGAPGGLPVRTAVARLGRGCLIALPLAGAGFAAWIGRADFRRTRQELELARTRLALAEKKHHEDMAEGKIGAAAAAAAAASPPMLDTSTVRWFGVATAADMVDVVGHLVAAYGLYQGWAPEGIVNAEIASLASAVVSTGGAVRGEYLVARRVAAEALESGQ